VTTRVGLQPQATGRWKSGSSTCTTGGTLVERVKYSAYGVATRLDPADYNQDGFIDFFDDDGFDADHSNTNALADFDYSGTVNATDSTTWTTAYLAGNITARGVLSTTNASTGVNNRSGYAGYQFSPATQQYHVRHRAYDPLVGGWGSRDMAGYTDGFNTYSYVKGMPIIATDPTGLVHRLAQPDDEGGGTRLGIDRNFTFDGDVTGFGGVDTDSDSGDGDASGGNTTDDASDESCSEPTENPKRLMIFVAGGTIFSTDYGMTAIQRVAQRFSSTENDKRIYGHDADWFRRAARWIREQQQISCRRFCKSRPVVLIGFSWGADAAYKVANQLSDMGYETDVLIMMDPIEKPFHFWPTTKPAAESTSNTFVYRQTIDRGFAPFFVRPYVRGYSVAGSQDAIVDDRVRSSYDSDNYWEAHKAVPPTCAESAHGNVNSMTSPLTWRNHCR
jgi:RHS repeat-associated protein